jgi:RNA polymerase sigma factor (sigma-70 family)
MDLESRADVHTPEAHIPLPSPSPENFPDEPVSYETYADEFFTSDTVAAIYASAYRICKDHHRAQDMAQQAILDTIASQTRADDAAPYFKVVIRRKFISDLRKQNREISATGTDILDTAASGQRPVAELVAAQVDTADTLTIIARLIATSTKRGQGLTAEQKEVLCLTALEYTPEQIAEQIGVSSDTVRARLKRARKELRKRLNDDTAL